MSEKNKNFSNEIYRCSLGFEKSPIYLTAIACIRSKWGKNWVGNNNISAEKADDSWKGKKILLRDTVVSDTVPVLLIGESIISQKLLKGETKKYIINRWFKDYDSMEEAIKDQCLLWDEQEKHKEEIKKMCHILSKLGLK